MKSLYYRVDKRKGFRYNQVRVEHNEGNKAMTNARLEVIEGVAWDIWTQASHDLVACNGGEIDQTSIVEYVADQLASREDMKDWMEIMHTDRHCLLCNWLPNGACL